MHPSSSVTAPRRRLAISSWSAIAAVASSWMPMAKSEWMISRCSSQSARSRSSARRNASACSVARSNEDFRFPQRWRRPIREPKGEFGNQPEVTCDARWYQIDQRRWRLADMVQRDAEYGLGEVASSTSLEVAALLLIWTGDYDWVRRLVSKGWTHGVALCGTSGVHLTTSLPGSARPGDCRGSSGFRTTPHAPGPIERVA